MHQKLSKHKEYLSFIIINIFLKQLIAVAFVDLDLIDRNIFSQCYFIIENFEAALMTIKSISFFLIRSLVLSLFKLVYRMLAFMIK